MAINAVSRLVEHDVAVSASQVSIPAEDEAGRRLRAAPVLIGVGGFLGAGKTTAILAVAARLRAADRRVAIVTNDQASGLVDTALARSALAAVAPPAGKSASLGAPAPLDTPASESASNGRAAPATWSSATLDAGRVVEIAGGCFCCRLDDLNHALAYIVETVQPDVILAEAVGSCTDLAASVYQPIRQLGLAPVRLGPLTVVVDAVRLAALHRLRSSGDLAAPMGHVVTESPGIAPADVAGISAADVARPNGNSGSGGLAGPGGFLDENVAYLYAQQMREADVILLNKADAVDPATLAALRAYLASVGDGALVLPVSALTGQGLEAWARRLSEDAHAGSRVLDLDYDRYAAAEASLGWLNLVGRQTMTTGETTPSPIRSAPSGAVATIDSPVDGTPASGHHATAWARAFLAGVAAQAQRNGAEVAHVKLHLASATGACTANLVSNRSVPYVSTTGMPSGPGSLVINARVGQAPSALRATIERAISAADAVTSLATEIGRMECFAPARPAPAYRLAPVVPEPDEHGATVASGEAGKRDPQSAGVAVCPAPDESADGSVPSGALSEVGGRDEGRGASLGAAPVDRAASAPTSPGLTGSPSRPVPPSGRRAPTWRGRSFTGQALQAVAFPLGGIGTGTVSLGGRGNLQDWEIFNRPAKGKNLPYTFFAIWAQAAGAAPVARVLERRLLPPYAVDHGIPPTRLGGLPRLREARFTGAYPFARIAFQDDALPLQVELEAFNPMVPLDAELSGLPVAIFKWRLRNPGPQPVAATIALSLCNAAGYDGQAPFGNRPTGPFFGGNVNRWTDEGGARGLAMSGPQTGGASAGEGAGATPTPTAGSGSLAIASAWPETTFLEHWERAGWFDSLQSFWDDFRTDGRLPDRATAEPSPEGLTDIGTLGLRATVPAGGEVTLPFVLAWHFPHLTNYWNRNLPVFGARLGNWYARGHGHAWDVARDVCRRLPDLESQTRAFAGALFSSTLPPVVLDAVSSQMSIIRSTTCLRTEDGAFHAFEGCNDSAGCCPMDCTHVWNYEQALAHLYPALERSMRETDFRANTWDSGRMSFRTLLPTSAGERWDYKPAADGQMGCVLKLYREWQLSGDTAWLRALWPQARRALEWAWTPGSWDADQDGVMEGEQHNTYDIEFYGPNTMCGALYLGALRAAGIMADALGEAQFASRCRAIFESGRARYDAQLWNGEFYEQRVEVHEIHDDAQSREDWHPSPIKPGETQPRYQYGPGCLADQLLGQWFCHVAGLGYVLPQARVRTALGAVYRHNWRLSLDNHESCQRTYALNDEAGLLLCSWPRGGRPAYPFPYADEVWTGIEYQVAAHLIYEGMVAEGLRIVAGVRARHDGVRRNPWDEFECGHHYARALASWSVLLAFSGYSYNAINARLRFDPRRSPDQASRRFRCFFSTGHAWGVYEQPSAAGSSAARARRSAAATSGAVTHTLEVHAGRLTLRHLDLPSPTASAAASGHSAPSGELTATLSVAVTLDGRRLGATVSLGERDGSEGAESLTASAGGLVRVTLSESVTLQTGSRLAVRLGPA